MTNHLRYLCILSLALIVSACQGNVRESLGLKKEAPDEFMVLAQPELSAPPNFDLAPPSSTLPRRISTVRKRTEEQLYDLEPSSALNRDAILASGGERAFLKDANTTIKTDPAIREKLEQERAARTTALETANAPEEPGFFERISHSILPTSKDPIVDAEAEQERVREKTKKGEPITGDGAAIVKQEETVIDRLLD